MEDHTLISIKSRVTKVFPITIAALVLCFTLAFLVPWINNSPKPRILLLDQSSFEPCSTPSPCPSPEPCPEQSPCPSPEPIPSSPEPCPPLPKCPHCPVDPSGKIEQCTLPGPRQYDWPGPPEARFEAAIPSNNPRVCFAFIACGRYKLLGETVESVYTHMALFEPNLPFESVWIDQSVSMDSRRISSQFAFSVHVVASRAKGRAWPYNAAFSLCTAPYIRNIEPSLIRRDFIQQAIEVIESNVKVSGVLLRSHWPLDLDNSLYEVHKTTAHTGADWCLMKTRTTACSSYTNGATIYSLERLRSVGPVVGCGDPEYYYAMRVMDLGFSLASVQRKSGCHPCSSNCSMVAWHSGGDASTKTPGGPCTSFNHFGF